jgi:hypothetical protein
MPEPVTLVEQFDETHNVLLQAGAECDGQPYLFMDDASVSIVAGESDRPDRGISVTHLFGTQITGPMSFAEMPENISFGCGYWRLNPLVLTCIGSSAAMPVPMLVYGAPRILAAAQDMANIGASIGV